MCKIRESVVIIGGGLVGPLSALFLAKRGYKVSLYERREDPRCVNTISGKSINLALSNRARRALRQVDLEEEILKCGTPMKGRHVHHKNGNNRSILYDPISGQSLYSISRNELNKKLLDATEKYKNIRLYFNHKLVNVDLENGVLTFSVNDTGHTIAVKADFMVGADGAFSTLRQFMQRTPLFNFTQTYLDHGYMELYIPPELGRSMVANHLHIWPRNEFMMIALPNQDGSWTVTLFMPFEQFKGLNEADRIIQFFRETFSDSVDLIGEKQLIESFLNVKPSTIVSIKCGSFHFGRALIIGDAAHAMVPFYGQGMNAGFEDCSILNSIFEKYNDDISLVLQKFTEERKHDANAISDLAMYNYVEMRDLVVRPTYLIRKAFDDVLFQLFPNIWIPLYNSVTFSEMRYKECVDNRIWQDKIVKQLKIVVALMSLITLLILTF